MDNAFQGLITHVFFIQIAMLGVQIIDVQFGVERLVKWTFTTSTSNSVGPLIFQKDGSRVTRIRKKMS